MTIKAKLITNLLLTTAIIFVICLGGYSSLRFIQEKFFFIAEKSTPYQMRTVEFDRELQICITSLLKVNVARTADEYARFRTEAQNSLNNLKSAQEGMEALKGDSKSSKVTDEFRRIAEEIILASAARIASENAATVANEKVTKLLQESSVKLKDLENRIIKLQSIRSAAFAKALKNTALYSSSLRVAENLRNQLKELQAVATALVGTTTKTSFLISRGKVNTLLARINKNRHSVFIASDLQNLSDDAKELLELQANAVAKKDMDSKQWAVASLKEFLELNNRLDLTMNQEIELLSLRVENETKLQGILFGESNRANEVLLANSALAGMGLSVAGKVNRLFSETSAAELDKGKSELVTLFNNIHGRAESMEQILVSINAADDAKMLHLAHNSLETLRTELFSSSGIAATLKNKLKNIETANVSADKLHAIAISQSLRGKETVSNARAEQEQSIATVNSIIQNSIYRIAVACGIAVAIGMLFGFWILRSVLTPLRVILEAIRTAKEQGIEKAALAEAVAAGNLDLDTGVGTSVSPDSLQIKNDEFGEVLQELIAMSGAQGTLDRAFSDMTTALRISRDDEERRDRLKNGLYELNIILREERIVADLADETLAFMAGFLGAGVGIMYLYDEKGEMLQTISTYAISKERMTNWSFLLGEGLPGQVALERKMIFLDSVPPGYLQITSATGEAKPSNVVVMPIMHNDILAGVLELGSLRVFTNDDFDFLRQALEGIAIAININSSRQMVNELLEQTQEQAEELRVQQEELQQSNEELMERAEMLRGKN